MIFNGNGFVELPVNTSGRDFIVGDLHGQFDRLMAVLNVVEFSSNQDRLIAVGDVIDKGPGGQVLLWMLKTEPWFYSTLGNHELMMRGALGGNPYLLKQWARNHNQWAAQVPPADMDELLKIIDGMPVALELPLADGRRIGVVHAEIDPGTEWDAVRSVPPAGDREAEDHDGDTVGGSLLWGRRRATAGYRQRFNPKAKSLPAPTRVRTWQALQPVPGIDLVVAGHTKVTRPATPMVVANCIFLETAAFQPQGWLTLLDPRQGCYWQAGGKRNSARGPLPLPAPQDPEPFRPTPRQIEKSARADEQAVKALRLLLGSVV